MEKLTKTEVPAELVGCGAEKEDAPTRLYADYC